MWDKEEESIKTYISTLSINLSGNCETSNSESDRLSSKDSSQCPPHTSQVGLGNSKDVTSYREACNSTEGTYFQLVTNQKYEDSQGGGTSASVKKGKTYFEGLSDTERESSFSNELQTRDTEVSHSSAYESSLQTSSSTSVVQVQKSMSSESTERSSAYSTMKLSLHEEDSLSVSESTKISEMALDSQVTSPTSSTTSQESTTSLVSQTSIQENRTITKSRGKTSYDSSSDRYGETDWYMDILLRMQALDMKQQNLIVQYDFLGKLADENREGLKQARDWARYETDMSNIEVY